MNRRSAWRKAGSPNVPSTDTLTTILNRETLKTTLIFVGKTVDKNVIPGLNDYLQRIQYYDNIQVVIIPELKNAKSLSIEQQKQREGELILKNVSPTDDVILLDEHGKEMRSVEFAQWIHQKQLNSRRLLLVIGGPYGFSPEVKKRANGEISLSKMTFSHQMIRLLIAEQIYRAHTILKNEPYHHE